MQSDDAKNIRGRPHIPCRHNCYLFLLKSLILKKLPKKNYSIGAMYSHIVHLFRRCNSKSMCNFSPLIQNPSGETNQSLLRPMSCLWFTDSVRFDKVGETA